MLTTGGKVSTYDSESRLRSMNGGAVSIVYDGDGNRVAKTASGVTTRYLVDELNPTGYAQVVEELVGTAVQREYTYGLQRIDENQLISNTWTPSFYGYDGGGSVRQLTNSSGAVTDKYDYDAFGNLINTTGTTPNSYRYRGEQYDSDLGLYYLRARYYNPVNGRFLSRDPENGYSRDPRSLHKYLYAGGDPVNFFDPNGRAAAADYQLVQLVALTVATGAVVYNYELHKDETQSALQQLGSGISNLFSCEAQYEEDLATCRQNHKRSCYAQAAERYAACLAVRQIPPFNF